MTKTPSLKTRLILIILVPLVLIAAGVGWWSFTISKQIAKERFDRSLLSTALAISRDVAVSGGDALSAETRDLINDTSGGPVFYNAYAPDGVFVTGYATPPIPPAAARSDQSSQTYFDALYLGDPVRVLLMRDAMLIDGLSGEFTFTVWQNTDVRDAFERDLLFQTFIVIAVLILSVSLIVWTGVGYGLRPLLDLEDAISKRSSDDLSTIQRAVPAEAQGIVSTLNALLSQVADTMRAKNDFISNAAHQLRNPIAGVLSMAEAVQSAPNDEIARERSHELVDAAKKTSDLANKLLTMERANALLSQSRFEAFDLSELVSEVVAGVEHRFKGRVELSATDKAPVEGDRVMMGEAIANLLDNAIVHGGGAVTRISVALTRKGAFFHLRIHDDGVGVRAEQIAKIYERFGQIEPSHGSGLGIPIAQTVLQRHGGSLEVLPDPGGFLVELQVPVLNP